MRVNSKLMDMLTGYAASHQNPWNVFVHMIGIPCIMFGALIPLTWVGFDVAGIPVNLAYIVMAAFFVFYLTLDAMFAVVFYVIAMSVAAAATLVGEKPLAVSGSIAAVAFFGGYAAQFLGHAIEKSMPVLVKHPIQANLAAPFFVVVELFKILGIRRDLFDEVQRQIALRRQQELKVGGS